ncbi:MAG: hypothetical protein ACK5MF_04180 [Vibrio sp.]|uniref:hypothetical protein n=1 Tax=Vibrio sp. TaxID=678 RepID=UPI003A8812F0
MDLLILLYLLIVVAASTIYHLKVQNLTKKRCVYLMSFLFSLKALFSFVYNCVFYKQQLIEFLPEETMIVCSLALLYISWVTLEPLLPAKVLGNNSELLEQESR